MKTVTLELPPEYRVNNAFNFEDIRPWLSHTLQPSSAYHPVIEPHQDFNRITTILDRRPGPARHHSAADFTDPLEQPCEYLVLRENGEMGWTPHSSSEWEDVKAREFVIAFECRYPRELERPCIGVKDYPEVDPDYDSPDEMPLGLRKRVKEVLFEDL
jgi:hypothetical protein